MGVHLMDEVEQVVSDLVTAGEILRRSKTARPGQEIRQNEMQAVLRCLRLLIIVGQVLHLTDDD